MCIRKIFVDFFSCKKKSFWPQDIHKILHIHVRSERRYCKCTLPCSSLFLKSWGYISFLGSRAGWQATGGGVLCRLIWDTRADINRVSVTGVPTGYLSWSSCVCNVCCWAWNCGFCWWYFGWDICWDHFYFVDFSCVKIRYKLFSFPYFF